MVAKELSNLPPELIDYVAKHLPVQSLAELSLTCKDLRNKFFSHLWESVTIAADIVHQEKGTTLDTLLLALSSRGTYLGSGVRRLSVCGGRFARDSASTTVCSVLYNIEPDKLKEFQYHICGSQPKLDIFKELHVSQSCSLRSLDMTFHGLYIHAACDPSIFAFPHLEKLRLCSIENISELWITHHIVKQTCKLRSLCMHFCPSNIDEDLELSHPDIAFNKRHGHCGHLWDWAMMQIDECSTTPEASILIDGAIYKILKESPSDTQIEELGVHWGPLDVRHLVAAVPLRNLTSLSLQYNHQLGSYLKITPGVGIKLKKLRLQNRNLLDEECGDLVQVLCNGLPSLEDLSLSVNGAFDFWTNLFDTRQIRQPLTKLRTLHIFTNEAVFVDMWHFITASISDLFPNLVEFASPWLIDYNERLESFCHTYDKPLMLPPTLKRLFLIPATSDVRYELSRSTINESWRSMHVQSEIAKPVLDHYNSQHSTLFKSSPPPLELIGIGQPRNGGMYYLYRTHWSLNDPFDKEQYGWRLKQYKRPVHDMKLNGFDTRMFSKLVEPGYESLELAGDHMLQVDPF